MPTVLISGVSRGIGHELARSFAADGWTVHGICRQPDKVKALKDLKGPVTLHRADVTDGLRIAGLARELSDEAIDLLINNAGVMGTRTGFGETDYDIWLDVLKTNTLAPLRLAERFIDHVAESERRLIVNVSSELGSIADNQGGGHYIYRSSKAALNMVTRSLAADLRPRGISVISVHPGWVQTDMGGAGAAISPAESVAGLRAVFEGLKPEDSGRFFNYDGRELPW